MSNRALQRSAVLSAFVLLRAVTGFSGDGKAIWDKKQYVSPVNPSQLFLYDTFPKNFSWGVGTGAFQVEGSWKTDGRGPSIWDRYVYSHLRGVNGTDRSTDSYIFLEKDLLALDFLGVSFLSVLNLLATVVSQWNSSSSECARSPVLPCTSGLAGT